jgi:ATP-binding cassette subfamily B multidrug efflux pump
MLRFFERQVDPWPERPPAPLPDRFFPFVWACSRGMRPWLLGMTLCTAVIGAFEAILFSMLGGMVDWLAEVPAAELWARQGSTLLMLAAVLMVSPLLVALQTFIKHQTLAANFPMRLRWDFHRRMLDQSLAFYQDEFAGRIATKLMQTALAVRDVWFIVADILVFVVIYFVTMTAVAGAIDLRLLLPFLVWLVLYVSALVYFVPRLGRTSQAQADARSLMTGRITDAYTNISTVKLFSHSNREADHARSAMQEFMVTAWRQMRLVSGFEVVNHSLSMLLIASTAGATLWLWHLGDVGPGAVAAATAMALRLNGISHWVMWEFSSLFEHIGTVQDGIRTLSRPPTVVDAPQAKTLSVTRGEVRFEQVSFRYSPASRMVIEGLDLTIRPGEKIGLVGPSGAGKSTLVNLLLRFHDVTAGRITIDGQAIDQVTQACRHRHGDPGHLTAASLGTRQHPVRPTRCR